MTCRDTVAVFMIDLHNFRFYASNLRLNTLTY
jgi:hypothetical protein